MKPLRFREDGHFTIAQFTDIHWKDGSAPDQQSRLAMECVLDLEQPDMVVFTGDTVYTGYVKPGGAVCTNPAQALLDAVDAAESRGIPWAYIFGNHDAESIITREQLMETALSKRFTMNEFDPNDGVPVGNFKLEVTDPEGNPAAALFFFDTGIHSPLASVQGYSWVRREQIDWYVRTSQTLPRMEDGGLLPALAFLHIPIPEYQEVWDTQVCYGHKFEDVCCPKVNTGLFASMLEMGNIMGTFAGHDHVNDYWGELYGIRLCYGRATGHHTYGREGFLHGSRIIRLRQGERRFESWLRLEDGSVIREQPEHKPEKPV